MSLLLVQIFLWQILLLLLLLTSLSGLKGGFQKRIIKPLSGTKRFLLELALKHKIIIFKLRVEEMSLDNPESIQDLKLAVIGLGYVGLPLAVEFGKKYSVIGFDINQERIKELSCGTDRTLEVTDKELKSAKNLFFSTKEADLRSANCFIVTVPTPIDNQQKPNLTPLLKASELVGKVIKKGGIIIYESTVYPGATEEECVPVIEKYSGLKFNIDFFCGYSPERINPGDKEHRITNIKKITSGSTPLIANLIDDLYKDIISAGTHKAKSIKVAEAAKVIENTQRDLNIALVNELAIIFNKMDIDTQEVLEAA
jgi:UDP-N-acetyl-D-galactosamine dehydrogenase